MPTCVALLRAVNVGGTGKLAMSDLKRICEEAGFTQVQTYIASGNVVFATRRGEAAVKQTLEAALAAFTGQPIDVMVRSSEQLAQVLANNPFCAEKPNETVAVFLDEAATPAILDGIKGQTTERIALGQREIYIAYGGSMGQSKLKVPAAAKGTARNINTLTKLVQIANSF